MPPSLAPTRASDDSSKLKILLAEDNPVNQKLAVRLLKKWGHDFVVVENGVQALDAVDREMFDLVLMDVQMPEMGGLEAAEHIREREQATGSHIPIVAMTAHAMAGDRERCLASGMDGYIAKPINASELAQVVRSLINGTQEAAALIPPRT